MRRRDEDYRGRTPPADFSRFVYDVRRGRPGALEVLQDVIEEWFPKQFEEAREDAFARQQRSKATATPSPRSGRRVGVDFVVLFDGRAARRRFARSQDPRSQKIRPPFELRSARWLIRQGSLPEYTAIVWWTRTGRRIPEKLRRLTRRRRQSFFDPTEQRWYGWVRGGYGRYL